MNTHDGKHIFISIWKSVWGTGVVVKRVNVRLCLFPFQPSGSEGQTDDIHKERERLRLVLKQMGRIKCPSEVCIPSFSLSLSLSFLLFALLCLSYSFFYNFQKLFPLLSCVNLRFFFPPFNYLSPVSPEVCSWQVGRNHINILHYSHYSAKRERSENVLTLKNWESAPFSSVFLMKVHSRYIPITSHQRKVFSAIMDSVVTLMCHMHKECWGG